MEVVGTDFEDRTVLPLVIRRVILAGKDAVKENGKTGGLSAMIYRRRLYEKSFV
ncbi:MAG: hypothetical protein LBK61_06450 [Spirochaetaceae bacterium]|jgi:hypothetical protein|nr:hypothetical protein [Spirochaetaceae bacterium]